MRLYPVEVNDLPREPTKSKNNDDDDEHSNHSPFSYFPLLLLINTQVFTGSPAKPNFVSGFGVEDGNDNQGNEVRYGKKIEEKTPNGPRLISKNVYSTLRSWIIYVVDDRHDGR